MAIANPNFVKMFAKTVYIDLRILYMGLCHFIFQEVYEQLEIGYCIVIHPTQIKFIWTTCKLGTPGYCTRTHPTQLKLTFFEKLPPPHPTRFTWFFSGRGFGRYFGVPAPRFSGDITMEI